jgi:hypothetical protein
LIKIKGKKDLDMIKFHKMKKGYLMTKYIFYGEKRYFVTQIGLRRVIVLPQTPERWDE